MAPPAGPNDATPSIPVSAATLADDTSRARRGGSAVTPVYTPEQELARFTAQPGYRIELVAAEPLVQDPVAIDFDPDGRMWVVEMRAYMPNLQGTGEDRPVGRIVVLDDTDDDGRMDRKTVFMDSLVMPRAVKVLSQGVLVAEVPHLWLVRDTNGDGRADTKELVRDDYGTKQSNPEHNANGLLWGIDNWIHNANYAGQFRLGADGKLAFRRTVDEGQWGVSSDEYGRLYRNSNEDPLRADLVPAHYALRNRNLPDPRGIYEQLTRNVAVWPGHKTPAVNRGYREQTLRVADSTLAHYTAAGSPVAYVGDRLPAELRRSVFVTEPAGNFVGRFVIGEDARGRATARPAYERAEFLTNSDQRFRPVNLATAPDGTLYVVDMYRGIIQHRTYITGYLEQKIVERGMEQPIGLGRIWRVVHTSARRGERPQLSRKSPAELVPLLAHANGWWRITAQQLLVERRARDIAPAVRELLRASADDRARLHALWTLDGLGESDTATVARALADPSPHVRAAAIRIAEPWLAQPAHPFQARVMALTGDRAPVVRRQLAASLGELPVAERDPALRAMLAASGDDPVVADLVVTAVAGREVAFLESVLASPAITAEKHREVVRSLSGAVVASRDAASVGRLVALLGPASRPRWQRLALLGYREDGPPARFQFAAAGEAGGEGFGGGGRRGAGGGRAASVTLAAAPAALLAALASRDTVLRVQAERFAAPLAWPGRNIAAPPARALTPAEQARYAAGERQYAGSCAACHQARGTGLPGVAKPLVASPWVVGPSARLIRIVLHGKEGEMLMPPLGGALTNEQIAEVLTYVRRSWGNAAAPIAPVEVAEIRGATTGRSKPWTEAELRRVNR
ncbi:MAG TPA: PVC-type heme-binding CxxCH protein [Gemmatimonadaceae bacterium]|nr:PVC-type heme-binding CxxCH protein [Gemmatimonadaceae bacterium]